MRDNLSYSTWMECHGQQLKSPGLSMRLVNSKGRPIDWRRSEAIRRGKAQKIGQANLANYLAYVWKSLADKPQKLKEDEVKDITRAIQQAEGLEAAKAFLVTQRWVPDEKGIWHPRKKGTA